MASWSWAVSTGATTMVVARMAVACRAVARRGAADIMNWRYTLMQSSGDQRPRRDHESSRLRPAPHPVALAIREATQVEHAPNWVAGAHMLWAEHHGDKLGHMRAEPG